MMLAWLLAAQLAGIDAIADERPRTTPTRDVDVTYAIARRGPDGHLRVATQRMRWAPGAGLGRVDPPTPGLYAIIDQHAHRLLMVRASDHVVMSAPLAAATGAGEVPGDDAFFQRLGDTTVASLPCTEWNAMDTSGMPATVCFTADGVLLRARHDRDVFVLAQQVSYVMADPAVFTLPAGYRVVQAR